MKDAIKSINYSLVRIKEKSVSFITKTEWMDLIRPDGLLTKLKEIPSSLNNPVLQASTLVAVASGIAIPNPGMDILRYDLNDYPKCINLDHYTIIENLPKSDIYIKALKIASIEDSEGIREFLHNYVWIVKDPPNENHRMDDFPQFILNALIQKK